jgi:hypothetical protein
MASPNTLVGVSNIALEGIGDALTDTIGEIFDIPEANLDGQLLEMVSGDGSYQNSSQVNNTSGSNAIEGDGSVDTALIDLLPF